MVQDISPKTMHNQFRLLSPSPEDYFFCFRGHDVWLLPDYTFPMVRMITPPEDAEFRYLFSIDEERYFLLLSEADLSSFGLVLHSVRCFRRLTPMDHVMAGFTAQHLFEWYRSNRFCGCCGGKTIPGTDERKMVCPACGNIVYPRLNPAILAAVTDGDRLLMTRYARGPVGWYVLVAGFVEIGETAEETVRREVLEETGIHVKNVRYFGSQPWGCSGNLTLGYFCELDGDDTVTVDNIELAEGKWFPREEVPVPDDQTSLTAEMIRAFADGRA